MGGLPIKLDIFDPSYRQLSKMTNLDVRTIQRSVRSIEKKGLIKVIERYSSSGYQLSNRYELTLGGEKCLREYAQWFDVLPLEETFEQDNKNNVYHLVAPSGENKGAASCPTPNVVSTVVKEQLQLTNRLTSEERITATEMLSKIPLDSAQQLADELRERMVTTTVKNPLGYLSKLIKAFENGTFIPVLASRGAKARLSDKAKSEADKNL